MNDKKDNEMMMAPVTNSPLVKANIPHSTTDTLENDNLGVIIGQQHQWDNPKNPLNLTSKTFKSPQDHPLLSASLPKISALAANQERKKNVATGRRETARTPNKAQAQTKPKLKKQPENANQREIRLQRNRRTAKARRDKQRVEVDAKRRQITELAMRNNGLRQRIQNKLQELLLVDGRCVQNLRALIVKMNFLVLSFTQGTNTTQEDGGPLNDSISHLSISRLLSTLPATVEFNQALRQLVLQQPERSKHAPQELSMIPQQHSCQMRGSQLSPRSPNLDSDGLQWHRQYLPQQQEEQLKLIYDRHQTLVKLYSIRGLQLQQEVNSKDRDQQLPYDVQLHQSREEGQGIWHDDIALDERKKALDSQGELKGGTKEQQQAGHHRQGLEKKRQRIRQDEITLHQWHRQDQPLIDHRWQQLKEEVEETDDGGEGEKQGMREDDNALTQDWQQIMGNLRQKLSGDCSHEDHQRQQLDRQWQQIQDQTQDQELRERERKNAESDVAQSHRAEDRIVLYNMYKTQDKSEDKCTLQTEQVQQHLEDYRHSMYQNEMISMSQQVQESQQQNFHYPNHLTDRVDDQQQNPRENDHFVRLQREHGQGNISQRDQISLTQSQRIARCVRQQQGQQQGQQQQPQQPQQQQQSQFVFQQNRRHRCGWQEVPPIGQHGIDASQQLNKQPDTYSKEEAKPNHADLHMQCGAMRQEQVKLQWAKEGQDQYQDQTTTERSREEQPCVDMKGDLSLDQRNQLADFLQRQMRQIETEEITQYLEPTEKKDSMIN